MTVKRTTVKKLRSGAKIVTTSKYVPPPRPKQIHHHHHHTTVVREKDPSCFPSDAKVLTPSGWKAIRQIQAGEFVVSIDPASSRLSARRVVRRIDHERAQIWEISIEGRDSQIRTTCSHRFLSTKGWVQAHQLKRGDELILIDENGQREGTVLAVAPTLGFECVHNLRTETDHNFIVDGAVAHNFVRFPLIRSLLATLVEKLGSKAPFGFRPAMNF